MQKELFCKNKFRNVTRKVCCVSCWQLHYSECHSENSVAIHWLVLVLKSLIFKVSRFIEIPFQFISIYSTEICPEVGFVHLSLMSANRGRHHLIADFFRLQLLLVLILCT